MKMAKLVVKNALTDFVAKNMPEKKPKLEKVSRKERRERFKKRMECLSPEEQAYLRRKQFMDAMWPIFRGLIVFGLCFIII